MKRPAFIFPFLLSVLTSACSAHAEPARASAQPQSPFVPLEQLRRDVESRVAAEMAKLSPPPTTNPPSPNGLVELPVPGYGNAVVSVPRGAIGPKPVMVAGHGRSMGPGICEHFRNELVGDRGFILCPRGTPWEKGGYTHGKELPHEIDAGLAALRARFGVLVDPGPMIYVGYSQSAYLANTVVMRSPARFPRAIVIEGTGGGWDAKTFARAGGQRVLFACGQAPCAKAATPLATAFLRAGVGSDVHYAPGAGHAYGGAVGDGIKARWAWLVQGDPRWAP